MPWPVDNISTGNVDAETDTVTRTDFLNLFRVVKALIAGRGTASGVASLDANGKVPDAQIGRGAADGVASLGSGSKVPVVQLPAGTADGVAGLDANAKVPKAQLPDLQSLAKATNADIRNPSLSDNVKYVDPYTLHHSERLAAAWADIDSGGQAHVDDSFNVSSVTDIGTGRTRVNFDNPMANQNYSVVASNQSTAGADVTIDGGKSAAAFAIGRYSVHYQDGKSCVAVFGDPT